MNHYPLALCSITFKSPLVRRIEALEYQVKLQDQRIQQLEEALRRAEPNRTAAEVAVLDTPWILVSK